MLKKQRSTQLLVSGLGRQVVIVFGITIITAVAVTLAISAQFTKLLLQR